MVDLTKKTAERSKLNGVEMEANPEHLAKAPSALATTVAHVVLTGSHCATTVAHVVLTGSHSMYHQNSVLVENLQERPSKMRQ